MSSFVDCHFLSILLHLTDLTRICSLCKSRNFLLHILLYTFTSEDNYLLERSLERSLHQNVLKIEPQQGGYIRSGRSSFLVQELSKAYSPHFTRSQVALVFQRYHWKATYARKLSGKHLY